MDISPYYCLKCIMKRGALHVDRDSRCEISVESELSLGQRASYLDEALLRGEVRPASPVVYKRQSGKNAYDFVSTSSVAMRLISNRVEEIFRVHGFTGWKTFPVRVFGPRRVELEGYHGLAVTGRCGPVDPRRGEYRPWSPSFSQEGTETESPSANADRPIAGFAVHVGAYFDEASWDGSDLFLPEGRYSIFTTHQVRNALVAAGITNIEMIPLSKYESIVAASEVPKDSEGHPL